MFHSSCSDPVRPVGEPNSIPVKKESIFDGAGSLRQAFTGKIEYTDDKAWLNLSSATPNEKSEFLQLCRGVVSRIEVEVSRKPDADVERFNFYLARAYRILSEALDPIDKDYAAICREKAIQLASLCYQKGHPGAAELLAQLYEGDGAVERELRIFGATNGCKTSARLLAMKFPEPIELSEDGETICRLAVLDMLFNAYRGQYFDFPADAPPPLSSWFGEGELIILESKRNERPVSFTKIHHDAQRIFNTFLEKKYHKNEIDLDDW